MATLEPREKAECIVELFRSRRPTEVLPAELYPASLDEAYAIGRAFQEIEEARGRGAIAGYKIGLTTPVMQKLCGVDEPCYGVIFARELPRLRAAARPILVARGIIVDPTAGDEATGIELR